MNYLLIDTSNQPLSVALVKDDKVEAEINSNEKRNHSAQLMPAVEKLFESASFPKNEVDAVVVAQGPGSYTGLRIGVTVAKTLAYSLDAELYGVSSLKALAATIDSTSEDDIVPIFDARREAVYAGVYRYERGELVETMPEQYITIQDLLAYLEERGAQPLFVGQDADKLSDKLNGNVKAQLPHAEVMTKLINSPVDITTFTPNYLKLSEAERNWQNQQNKS
ncbi:tRNA (adenosine(37)-N6)-threonylcarbamoyltransferase complex dimerization subunit type 1 TsaB [Staphylococcus pettenkoferi]|uniref:tRNA (adenosine(37)-N6)-threonylcarbamoyltransferase complex dimerization subunit type 1 TsaB n=1 Tax=Staphylococcus pettenkoferi TaxID=170573 RepID=UPI002276D2B7|nr:tRNA (adenosine(37)-N6)-threonylcarbamoyltransferase complex dimerization subunit type 1 TsaB [Staphylococcus pettenkoferi]MCY1576694.1 tRNA (adenosine(37)-N6)-threonylcarbamoyltransferase complex dimerization subunit type 1 TsaB [Staphylococcus pettenkoferi]